MTQVEIKELDNLVTVKSFARLVELSPSLIYRFEKIKLVTFVEIDGVRFVDKKENMDFFNKRRKAALIKRINHLLKITE